jgi:hypothetical protein
MSYRCARCNEVHDDPPMAFHSEAPSSWYAIPEDERSTRARLSDEQCEIDDKFFFVRGLIEIPVLGLDEPFAWGVWVSLSRANYERACELWAQEGRESEPPYFAWLNTQLAPHYPSTLNLKTNLHTRAVGLRPLIEIEPTDHPLAREQREGMTRSRLEELWQKLLH